MHVKALAAATLATALSIGAAGAATEWDLPLAWPESNFHVRNVRVFAEEVKKATNGELVINIHSGGSLGYKGPEMLKVLRDGQVPIGDYFLSQQVGDMPFMGLDGNAFLVNDYEELKVLYKHWRPVLEKEVEKNWNQKILYVVPWPAQYVYLKHEAKSLDDFKGIKIRTYNQPTTEMFNRLGMTSVLLPWGEVVPALAAGTIGAVTTSTASGVDGKFWEFLKFIYPTNHVWGSNVVAVNLDAWNSLKPAQQKALQDVATRLEPTFWQVSKDEDAAKMKQLNDGGIKIGTVTAEMKKDMEARTADMLGEFIKKVPQAEAIIAAYKKETGR